MKNNSKNKFLPDKSSWMVGENRRVEDIPPKDLALYLARFFSEYWKTTDKEYEPVTLK